MNRNRITAYSDTALDVILRTIRVVHQVRLAFFGLVVPIDIPEHERIEQMRIAGRIVVRILRLSRVPKDNDIARLGFRIAGELLVSERNRRTVSELEAKQEISRMQGIFHGAARNLERLDDILDNDQCQGNGDDDFPRKGTQEFLDIKFLLRLFHKNPYTRGCEPSSQNSCSPTAACDSCRAAPPQGGSCRTCVFRRCSQ